jgi:hypothetical protein
MKKAYEK